MEELDEFLEHAGVKGMKWGVRKSGQNGVKKVKKPGRLKEEWSSLSRERQWKKVLNDVDKLSTKDINIKVSRIQKENSLKELSRTKNVGTPKDKADYRRRGKMSDEELSRKVKRLRTKKTLTESVNKASERQTQLGKKIMDAAAPLAIKYALGQSIDLGDILSAASKVNPSKSSGKSDAMDLLIKKASDKAAKKNQG